jgi:phosphatidylserine/phosphatidylglycerophosphate/cardiolipin synthase-like enzyme
MEPSDREQRDNSISISEIVDVESHFKNLDSIVISRISEADAVVGCVAWLTNRNILDALANVDSGVSIVVQKEDFLRPDYSHESSYKERLRQQYERLRPVNPSWECQIEKRALDLGEVSPGYVDISIRCVGHLKESNAFAMPRMHHKFLVFCESIDKHEDFWNLKPYAVWTGSFNMTDNATKSNENGIFIKNQKIAKSYFMEWFDMLMISEGLDWSSEYAAPDIQFNNLACIS